MIWSSFVATDLQLFLFLPIVVSIYRCSKIAGTVLIVLMIIAGATATGIIIWFYDILPGYLFALDVDMIYFALTPYIKLDCLAIGVLMAMHYLKV